MEGERLGRVVAVTPLSQLSPVACAASMLGVTGVSGLPPPLGSASPAVQSNGGEEAPTGARTNQPTVRRTGLWAAPVSHQQKRHAHAGSRVHNALGPATSTPEVTPVALRYLRTR